MNKKQSKFEGIYNNILYGTILSFLVTGLFLYIMSVVSQFSNIENRIFTKGILIIMLILLLLNLLYFFGFSKGKKIFRKVFFICGIFLLLVGAVGSFYVYRADSSLKKLINKDNFETVEFSIIGFSEEDTIEKMNDGVLGFIEHDEAFDKIMQDAVRPHSRSVKYLEYPDYYSLLDASVKGNIQYALVPKDYSRLDESYPVKPGEDLPLENAQVLFGFSTKINDDITNIQVLEEPFSVLLLGNNGGLSDSIILATINPKTLNVTMTSIARDSYLPIACYPNQTRDKLNHARARGRQCIEDTIENYLDVEIDFYFETDFYALEKIVDALGGIELESPVAFGGSLPKEHNPKEYDEVWINKGMQKMDGKQAITFARERHHMPSGDFDRQLNQQYVIKEVANAIIKERNPEKLVSVLEGASQNIRTNLSINTITQLLGYAIQQFDASPLDAMNTFRIESSQIMGTTPMIDSMSVIVPYKNDVLYVREFIKNNLEETPSLKNIRSFEFNINEPYRTRNQKRSRWGDASAGTIDIGRPNIPVETPGEESMIDIPDFTVASRYSRTDLEQWADKNGIELNITIVEIDSSVDNKYIDGQVINQENAGKTMSLEKLRSKPMNVTFVKDTYVAETTYQLPSYGSKDALIEWANSIAGLKLNINTSIAAPSEDMVGKPVKDKNNLKPGSYSKAELNEATFYFYGPYEDTGESEGEDNENNPGEGTDNETP